MPNNFDKFTQEAKLALKLAQNKSKKAKLDYVGTEHILIGILSQPESLGASVLLDFGVSLESIQLVLEAVGRSKPKRRNPKNTFGLSGFAKKVIEDAVRVAYQNNHTSVGTEHLVYALVSQENTAATVILENMKIAPADIKQQIEKIFQEAQEKKNLAKNLNPLEILFGSLQALVARSASENSDYSDAYAHKNSLPTGNSSPASRDKTRSRTPALDYFATDLTAEARAGKIDPVIGREKEIARLTTILNRKTKNNPVLIGEAGVGKTAVVEGLAQAIVAEKIPAVMQGKRVLMVSMTALVAGTKYRGEFEERFKSLVTEATSLNNEVILFLDELHTVIGSGSAEGSLDGANILKPALARGKIQIIGATTLEEYRKHLEKDKAFARRFQQITIEEPLEENALKILLGLRPSFEKHHHVKISDSACRAAVKMSKRYLPERFLPDKAIDLIDEAASLKSIEKKTDSPANQKIKSQIARLITEKEAAVSSQNYEKAAKLRAQEIELTNKLQNAKELMLESNCPEITPDNIAKVVSNTTGIPLGDLLATDVIRLKNLEKVLAERIIGQKPAIHAIAQAVRRARVGLATPNRPIGSFIFLGPTGVGKTELVKTLAFKVYGSENALVKIDMSEFAEQHSASRLVGTTAGYIGYEEGGDLTEQVRRKPYSVVLFDELEKAHPSFQNLLLQVLEDGYLTDAKGRRIDFRNTIIVMTSNLGAEKMTQIASQIGFATSNQLKDAKTKFSAIRSDVLNKLEEHFRPEFLNRVDRVVVFDPLTKTEIEKIVAINLADLEARLTDKKIKLHLTKPALTFLSEKSYDAKFGARPVRRTLTELVEDELAEAFLEQKFQNGDTISLDLNKTKRLLTFKKV